MPGSTDDPPIDAQEEGAASREPLTEDELDALNAEFSERLRSDPALVKRVLQWLRDGVVPGSEEAAHSEREP